MQFYIAHEIPERMRVQLAVRHLSIKQADTLSYYLEQISGIGKVNVYERAGSVSFSYDKNVVLRQDIIEHLRYFSFENVEVSQLYFDNSNREVDLFYREKILTKIIKRFTFRYLMPSFFRGIFIYRRALRFIFKGIKSLFTGEIKVELLDATAITVALKQQDRQSAGNIMFLLSMGEILEEWTHKRTIKDLASSMSLTTTKVWRQKDGLLEKVDGTTIEVSDIVKVYMCNVIPFDGVVVEGDAMVNEASLTGEPLSKAKSCGSMVYAGTSVESGEILFEVEQTSGSSRYEQIIHMIEETEALKSQAESKASKLADKLVVYSLLTSGLVYALTRNPLKATAVLMVDYSCALKLAMPTTVLAAIRQARDEGIFVKGGKYMEKISEADTIVFDKTGTLTKAESRLHSIVSFCSLDENEFLRIAACLEEHFPHSIANAIVKEAYARGLSHEELHSDIEYVVAHGIASKIDGHKIVIGSYHFVFEDEAAVVPEGKEELFENLPEHYSHLYMAVDNRLIATLLIEDPLRKEAKTCIEQLKQLGIKQVVMMTGDSQRIAAYVADEVGVDAWYSEVMPADKQEFIMRQKELGHTVIMVGDGINDSPALFAADCGIAISDGSELARDIADVTIDADNLETLVTLKRMSNLMMRRIDSNYKSIIVINSLLILGGVAGIIQPTTSALLHNSSTIGITLRATKPLLGPVA